MIEINPIPRRDWASLDIQVPCKTIVLLPEYANDVSHFAREVLRVRAAIDKARGR